MHVLWRGGFAFRVSGFGFGAKRAKTLAAVTDCPQTPTSVNQKFPTPPLHNDNPSFARCQSQNLDPSSPPKIPSTMSNVNVSSDLLWAITRNHSSYIVKRGVGNERVIFSKEPLNLVNKHSRKHSGLVNEKAVGVLPGEAGGVTLITKKSHEKYGNKPASLYNTVTFSKNKSQRKTYAAVVNTVAKKHYRPDLRQEAVARASAIKRSQRPVKLSAVSKPRGVKAKKAAAE